MAISTQLSNKLPPWPRLSYALAKHLVNNDVPKTFLTPVEEEHLNTALVSFQQWQNFIELKLDPTESECQLTSNQLTAFRVRALLSEQFIPHFFHKQESQDRPCCQQLQLDIDKLCLEAKQLKDNQETTIAKLDIPKNQPMNTDSTTTEQLDEQKHAAQNSDHVPLLDIYHTLEFDMAAMIEQRKLEEYQAQEEVQDEEKSHNNSNSTLHILDDSDQFNLKYLLKGIADNREKTNLTDRELRNLLLEVKPHKSKWANDDKVGQEDLYEACEKLLTDLKNYTEHSTPFLTKVSKREAPDYFEVIKEPMDLGTVSKKLKAFQYKNKKEFARDLYLIYQNCLDYNTDPHSEYRKHAIAMRRKTDRLLPRVPDINVKERFGGDEGDDPMDMSEDERASATPAPEGVIPPIKLTLNNRERSASRASRERSITHDSLVDEGFHANYAGKHPKKGTAQPQTAIDTVHEEQSLHHELETDKGELQNTIWREVTKKTRAKVTHLHHQPESTKKLMRCSRTAFSRWLERHEGMGIYDSFDLNSEDEDGFDGGFFFSRKSDRPKPTDEDDAIRNDLFLPEYSTVPGLPDIEGVPEEITYADEYYDDEEDADEQDNAIMPSKKRELPVLDQYSASKCPEHGLGPLMDSNIRELANIRSIYKKCNAIRNNTPLGESNTTATKEEEEEDNASSIPAPIATPIPSSACPDFSSVEISQEATHQMMQRTVIQLLTHAGFEAAQSGPLNVITDLMAEYFTNLGKTVKTYCDTHGNDMMAEEILLHSLHENGVSQLEDLENYVTDDVEKYGHRLKDVSRRLEGTYQELVAGSTEEAIHDENDLFEDDDAFTAALFGEELGQDFFGFKDLGLDQEYNMSSLQIPSKLWFKNDESRLKKMAKGKAKEEPQLQYPAPPPFTPAENEDAFIGLLKPWYKKRLQDNPNAVEDEFKLTKKSNRPKNPPIHIRSANAAHINPNKRKALRDGSNTLHSTALMEEKKKRKRLLEESKAQKKKQRLELKAQKIAEKEQKKKLREENRERDRLAKQQKEKK
ncbi:hypothetical protein HMPREF1544_03540 [Mucor circinelloides 1006PhL]|uniref:Bromo domain-containing protein n=1 Tax=Mucor circinelloides f. circinelloides (strain 1006PhL) TaxID=1220926 RepID=S2K2X0_MUCC1|nr:hypothetical protein HMPREF1544_03540 [Mucor circinelloides 1006PhL]